MQPIISIEKIDKGNQVADTCVHFGFCTAVCPTYVLDGEENDSPRGRIALIKEMLHSGEAPAASTVTHVDRCLSCLSCATTCAAGVDYRTLVDIARDYIETSKVRPLYERMMRKALVRMMTTPLLMRFAMGLGKPFGKVSGRLPRALGALGRLAHAPALPALAPRTDIPRSAHDASHANTVSHANLALEKNDASPAPGATTSAIRKVALLEGCAQSVIGQEINASTRRLFQRLNIDVVDIGVKNACCGAMNLHMGYTRQATRQAARLVDAWHDMLESGKIDAIIVTTSGCGSVIAHYRELFEHDPVRLERACRVEDAYMDVIQLLAQVDFEPTADHRGARVAYHDSCSLRHGQKIINEPRAVLKKAGFNVMDIAESHLCCGSAGTYNILQSEIAQRLGQRKATHIAATNPDVVAAANMGCVLQISLYLKAPIVHSVQLVDWATGGPRPLGMETFIPGDAADNTPIKANDTPETRQDDIHPVSTTTDSLW